LSLIPRKEREELARAVIKTPKALVLDLERLP